MILYPTGCITCELGLAICEGMWSPHLCVLQRKNRAYRKLLRNMSASGESVPPEGFDLAAPRAAPEFTTDDLLAAESCPHRTEIRNDPEACCSGIAIRCIDGRHPNKRVDFLATCARCIVEHGPLSPIQNPQSKIENPK